LNNIVKLEDIGFYTLSDKRCAGASENSDLQRCELILTGRCNFKCPYCRRVGGSDLNFDLAKRTVIWWCAEGLKNIRFSGGEPTLYNGLVDLVKLAYTNGVEHIAVSTNGSSSRAMYDHLLLAGVNDFSISLDACCSVDGDRMAGISGSWDHVTENIRYLSHQTYVTVGVVLTDYNYRELDGIIRFADSLGVSDIRIIPAAQEGNRLREVVVSEDLLQKYPILAYRIKNIWEGKAVRGLQEIDSKKCGLVLDDMAICQNQHYPCIIYMREGGSPIGKVGPNMRQERKDWFLRHDTHKDTICGNNCLDVCVDYNNKYRSFHGTE